VLERLHGEDSSSLSSSLWPGFSSTFTRAVDAAMAVRPLERPASIAAWLKLFEGRDPAPFDDVTRIAIMSSAPPPDDTTLIAVRPSAPVSAPKPAPKIAPAPVAAAVPPKAANPAPKRGSKGTLILFGVIAGFALLAVAGLVSQHLYKLPAADTPAPVAQAVNQDAPLGDKLNALMDAAQKAGIKGNEITALTSAKDKLEHKVHLSPSTIIALRKAYVAKADPSLEQVFQILLTLTVRKNPFQREMSLINVVYKP